VGAVRRLLAAAALIAAGLALPALASPAQAAVRTAAQMDAAALNWAEAHATGLPYVYGAAGPSGYDCSGLVVAAFAHTGITLPRTTNAMLASPLLIPVPLSQVRRGDLLFFGSGHVEFATAWHDTSFGAHDSGSAIGWITYGYGWVPTAAYQVA
jgi:cell wall-associated NlpC family hydrolase